MHWFQIDVALQKKGRKNTNCSFMLTAHCRRAAGLSFLQINGAAYYFPNCPLAQLAVWGTSSPGLNTVASISSRGPAQACVALLPNCVCVVRHLHTTQQLKCWCCSTAITWKKVKEKDQINTVCSECLTRVKGTVVRLLHLPLPPCCQAVIPERQGILVIYIISYAAVCSWLLKRVIFFSHSLDIFLCFSPLRLR